MPDHRLVARPSDGPGQQLRDVPFQIVVGRNTDGILHAPFFPSLINLWRRLALPKMIGNWSLTSLQQRLVKTGGRLIKHARYYWLLLAERRLSRRLFGSMLRMIAARPLPDG